MMKAADLGQGQRTRSSAIAVLLMFALSVAGAARADTRAGLAEFRVGRFAEAFQQWRDAAATGDAIGALFVGVLYDTGLGVAHDEALALQWYRQAAEAGSAAGAFNVGVMYDAGRGTAIDARQAAAWYARAAEQNYPRAEYNLAMLYEAGIGVSRDPARARQLYHKAAGHGVLAAQAHFAAFGRMQPDSARPQKRSGADAPMLAFQLAQQAFLARGPTEAGRAATLFRRAAEQRNALAEYDLGYCYEHGIGVPQDQVQAYRWYRSAASDSTDDAVRGIARAAAQGVAGGLNQAELRSPDRP